MIGRVAQLTGSHARGVLQVAEFFINDLLRMLSKPGSPAPQLAVRSRNHLVLHYGMFHATVELPPAMQAGAAPRLTVSLASIVVAWTLRAAVHQPFVHFRGRHVTVDLAAVPGLEGLRDLWPHLKAVRITTATGVVQLHFTLAIDGEAHA